MGEYLKHFWGNEAARFMLGVVVFAGTIVLLTVAVAVMWVVYWLKDRKVRPRG